MKIKLNKQKEKVTRKYFKRIQDKQIKQNKKEVLE